MDWESSDIRSAFHGVIRDSKSLKSSELEEKYKDFKRDHSKLYDMAIESMATNKVQDTLKKLNFMLDMRDKTKNGSVTKTSADLFVGNRLGHEYIYPAVGQVPSQKDYKRAIGEISKKEKDEREGKQTPDIIYKKE